MRNVIFGGANSLDNYIARPDEAVDWLMWSDEAADLMKDLWTRFDTFVMGRKTFEFGLRTSGGKNPYAGTRTVVFSRTLDPAGQDGVEIVTSDPGKFVRELKAGEGKEICVLGGGEIGKVLLEAGVVDEIGFNIHPVLLGAGVPLFHGMSHQIDLELLECRPFKNGCVYVNYRVKN